MTEEEKKQGWSLRKKIRVGTAWTGVGLSMLTPHDQDRSPPKMLPATPMAAPKAASVDIAKAFAQAHQEIQKAVVESLADGGNVRPQVDIWKIGVRKLLALQPRLILIPATEKTPAAAYARLDGEAAFEKGSVINLPGTAQMLNACLKLERLHELQPERNRKSSVMDSEYENIAASLINRFQTLNKQSPLKYPEKHQENVLKLLPVSVRAALGENYGKNEPVTLEMPNPIPIVNRKYPNIPVTIHVTVMDPRRFETQEIARALNRETMAQSR